MTTDLEKQFFIAFGIEPKYEDACTVEDKYWDNEELANKYGTFDQYMNCKCGNQENCTTECSCAYEKEIYPQITDRILLELICIISKYQKDVGSLLEICETDKNSIKEEVLDMLIFRDIALKQQVQALFKEE